MPPPQSHHVTHGGSRWRAALTPLASAALLALAASPALAQGQYFGQNKVHYRRYDWRYITSDHFEVYYYPGIDSLALRVLDLAEKTNIRLSRFMGHQLTRRVPIILYGSHNDFAQTNVTPELIDASTGGFTEVLRNRVVLPFSGSYAELRHVVVHELTHAFMFDLLYGGSAGSLISRGAFFSMPLWFAEGLAEYTSLGMEPNAEMFVRDGIISNYVVPLQYAGGYLVYKEGQSAIDYLVRQYGEDRLRDIMQKSRMMRNFDIGFERSMGMPIGKFNELWHEWLKKEYWPTVGQKQSPEQFARRLTNHRREGSVLNTSPAVSPDGDLIAFFSDRKDYTDLYLMSALDGRVLRRLIRGERNYQFESIPSFRSAITWSDDGKRLALVAKSGGTDALYVIDAKSGRVRNKFRLPCEALAYPAWSPRSDTIAVVGTKDGRSDLYLVDGKGKVSRLTNDVWDEKEPAWSPDGSSIAFSSDRPYPVVLHAEPPDGNGFGDYSIQVIDLATGNVHQLLNTAGQDGSPAWSPDGKRMVFISDRDGAPNGYLFDTQDSTFLQLTDVVGGLNSVSWSRRNDRVVFSAFNEGGWDIFAVREPISLDAVLARLRRNRPEAVLSWEEAKRHRQEQQREPHTQGALAASWPDSLMPPPKAEPKAPAHTAAAQPHQAPPASADSLRMDPDSRGALDAIFPPDEGTPATETHGAGATASGTPATGSSSPDSVLATIPHEPPPVEGGIQADTVRAEVPHSGDLPAWSSERGAPPEERPPAKPLPVTSPVVERGGPYALSDSVLDQKPERYRTRLSPEFANAGFLYASGFGVVGSTQLYLSDFLGDHNMLIAVDLFSASLEETNALLLYNYEPRRWGLETGVFHFKNYYSSRVTSFGEEFSSARLYSDRNYGVLFGTSYPFDRFRRVEFGFTQQFIDRRFFDETVFGDIVQTGSQRLSITSPSVSLVGDNALYSYYGPINGHRYDLTFAPAIPVLPNGFNYQTVTMDARFYWDLGRQYSFALRGLTGASFGPNAQHFFIGGVSTLRGYPDYFLVGTRVALMNMELRFPFIQQFGLVGPVPLGGLNLRGAIFHDAGLVWNEHQPIQIANVKGGTVGLRDLHSSFGAGIRTIFYFMIMRLDVAWRTDWSSTSAPYWQFSIGPDF